VPPAQVRIDYVDLIEMRRDHRMYEWNVHTLLPLGGTLEANAWHRPTGIWLKSGSGLP
jgi:hypothetical protein